MKIDSTNLFSKKYRNIIIVQDRDYWQTYPYNYDKTKDLVLTFCFGLLNKIVSESGDAGYIDHIVDTKIMEKYNYQTYEFFAKWHLDKEGNDIFAYKGISVGNAFRMEIWNEITYYPRLLISLIAVKRMQYETIFVGVNDAALLKVLDKIGIKAQKWKSQTKSLIPYYYFPIFQWMTEKIYKKLNLKTIVKDLLSALLDMVSGIKDKIQDTLRERVYVFVHAYYPTIKIIEQLRKDKKVTVVLSDYNFKDGIIGQRRISERNTGANYRKKTCNLILNFKNKKTTEWIIDGHNISNILYEAIMKRVEKGLPLYLKTLDSIIMYFKNKRFKLMVAIANIGMQNCLLMNYCKKNGINRYLIINGLLSNAYADEGKDADFINSFGEEIKKNYFNNASKVFAFGDPRMDEYITMPPNKINKNIPTITIGASGFNNVDLNSYIACEFEFLFDIMNSLKILSEKGRKCNIRIKVRTNGYIDQYRKFIDEYFSNMPVKIEDSMPMKQVLAETDLYISIYSQTLFEASALGIPTIYYKKDTEIIQPPFDGSSELVTAYDTGDLIGKIGQFYNDSKIFDSFLKKENMEKYVGPLDGQSTKRNLEFIYSRLLNK